MNKLATLLLFGVSTTALAGSPYYSPLPYDSLSSWKEASKLGKVGKIELDGTVDIPLYASTSMAPELLTYVSTSKEEKGTLFSLAPASSMIIVTEGFAADNELDIKEANKRLIPVPDDYRTGGEIKYVKIPELHVGDLVLKNVTAFVSSSDSKFAIAGNVQQKKASIGLAALDVSYAILESEGVLRVTEKNNGPALSEALNGTTIPYEEMPWRIGRIGPRSLNGKNDSIMPAVSLVVPASFNGPQTIPTLLSFHATGNELDSYYPQQGSPSMYVTDIRLDWMTPSIEGLTFPSSYVARVGLHQVEEESYPLAMIGSDVLSHYDVAVDKSTQTITFAPNTDRIRLSSFTKELDEATSNLEEQANEEGDDSSTDETETAINVSGLKKLIAVLEKGPNLEETLPHYEVLLADEEEKTDCALWMSYGHVQRQLGNLESSLSAYQESSRLYHSWWDIDLHQRMDINNAQGKMKDNQQEAAKERSSEQPINSVADGWYISQPESCYTADGYLAYTQMLLGKYDAVEPLYRENLDLDSNLARALGNTALLSNNTILAHEAYRQAIRLEDGRDDRRLNRIGLALVYSDQGKWSQADQLFQEAMELEYGSTQDILTTQLWLDQKRHFDGGEASLQAISDWIDSHPNDLVAHIAQIREYSLQLQDVGQALMKEQENSTDVADPTMQPTEEQVEIEQADSSLRQQQQTLQQGLDAALQKTDKAFSQLDKYTQQYAVQVVLLRAMYLAYNNEPENAQDLIDGLSNQNRSEVHLVSANIHALQGKQDQAVQALQRAVQYNPSHPGYALFLK